MLKHFVALQVTAGTVNYEGPITIRATSTGTDSTLAGIGRLVAEAQAREAPVQRLADAVAGKFCYSVMAASAATFAFWSLAGQLCSTLLQMPAQCAGTEARLLDSFYQHDYIDWPILLQIIGYYCACWTLCW